MDVNGALALVVALVVVAALAVAIRRRDGRLRIAEDAAVTAAGGWTLAGRAPGPDERFLLLQLSSPICAPCKQTATVLREFATRRTDVVHTEIDVADQPDAARTLNVMRTPTVVAFDRAGAEILRVSGVPRITELEAALDARSAADR